jgi:hypothetical protein
MRIFLPAMLERASRFNQAVGGSSIVRGTDSLGEELPKGVPVRLESRTQPTKIYGCTSMMVSRGLFLARALANHLKVRVYQQTRPKATILRNRHRLGRIGE